MESNSSTPQSQLQGFNTELRDQWSNPSEILAVLLIVGADVIQKALAQFSGQSFKPVAFSFGWVAYAYSHLLETVGHLKSMPEPDFPSYLINCRTGKIWEKSSWTLGRIIRHYDMWMDTATFRLKQEVAEAAWAARGGKPEGGIEICKAPCGPRRCNI
jgi:hypothetical protein